MDNPKLKARQPRGFSDRTSDDIHFTNKMISDITKVCNLYSFEPIDTPFFEYSDALGKFLPDDDRPNAGVFSLQDDDEKWMSLRYDLTAPLARHFAQNMQNLPKPYRTYRSGWVFRNEKPGPDRFRQFYQFDVDIVGAPLPSADAEICMMMCDLMEAVGLERGEYQVRINSRLIVNSVMEAADISDEKIRLIVLRAIDKLDRLGFKGVEELLGSGRKDKSGDFTSGAGLNPNQRQVILSYLHGNDEELKKLISHENFKIYERNKTTLKWIVQVIKNCGYGEDQIKIDPCVVRGLEYYTSFVYECELTLPTKNQKGEPVIFGAVAGGGRYDGLIERFTGQKVSAAGFSIGVSRLIAALKNLDRFNYKATPPVVVCMANTSIEVDEPNEESTILELQQYCLKIVSDLRCAGIRTELYQGNSNQLGRQLKYANRLNSPVAVICGLTERDNNTAQIKDLYEGQNLSSEISDREKWRANPTQKKRENSDIVSAVQEILEHNEIKSDG